MLRSLVVGDDEESDDDIEMGAQQADFKCPLTLTLLKDPVTSYVLPPFPIRFEQNTQLTLYCE